MLWKIYRFVIGRGSLPVLLTLSVTCGAAFAKGGLTPADALLVLLVASLQMFLLVYESLFDRAVPIEQLTIKNQLPDAANMKAIALATSVVPLLALLSAWAGWWVLFFVGVYLGRNFRVLVRRAIARTQLSQRALAELAEYKPLVAVYVSGLANVAYQINQWLPVLERLGFSVVVVARRRDIFKGMSATKIPVFYARNMSHVEKVLLSGVRTVLYPANTMHNVQALRQYSLNHFFINHGESDKAVNQSKMLQAYDKLLVAGPMAERRLIEAGLALREGQVEYVGRPQAEMLLEQLTDEEPRREPMRVLYAPTWEGFVDNVDYSSIRRLGLEILENLAQREGVEVVFKPHPYTGSRKTAQREYLTAMKSFCRANSIAVEESLSSIYECMNNSDVLICDVSSVLNDYLITRKPIVLCVNEMMQALDIDQTFPSARAAYKVGSSTEIEAVFDMLQGGDPASAARAEVRMDSLGDLPEGSLVKFRSVIKESVMNAV